MGNVVAQWILDLVGVEAKKKEKELSPLKREELVTETEEKIAHQDVVVDTRLAFPFISQHDPELMLNLVRDMVAATAYSGVLLMAETPFGIQRITGTKSHWIRIQSGDFEKTIEPQDVMAVRFVALNAAPKKQEDAEYLEDVTDPATGKHKKGILILKSQHNLKLIELLEAGIEERQNDYKALEEKWGEGSEFDTLWNSFIELVQGKTGKKGNFSTEVQDAPKKWKHMLKVLQTDLYKIKDVSYTQKIEVLLDDMKDKLMKVWPKVHSAQELGAEWDNLMTKRYVDTQKTVRLPWHGVKEESLSDLGIITIAGIPETLMAWGQTLLQKLDSWFRGIVESFMDVDATSDQMGQVMAEAGIDVSAAGI